VIGAVGVGRGGPETSVAASGGIQFAHPVGISSPNFSRTTRTSRLHVRRERTFDRFVPRRPDCLNWRRPPLPARCEVARQPGGARDFEAVGLGEAGEGRERRSSPTSPCKRGRERTSYPARLMSASSEEGFRGRGRHQE
jgi:hypothetical protein